MLSPAPQAAITVGKQAGLMIVKANPATKISDMSVPPAVAGGFVVFKDGVGYDSEKLIQSVQGLVGIR